MEEIWKDIEGYEGWYQVSNLGRVRSVDRIIEQWSRYGHTIFRRIKGKPINPTDNGNGYLFVSLTMNQEKQNHYVHRLVADAFIDNPEHVQEVNHLDYDKSNNSVANLEWITHRDNIRYSLPNMYGPKKNSLPGITGERYIVFNKNKNRYRLSIQRKHMHYEKSFATLHEAVEARGVLLGW